MNFPNIPGPLLAILLGLVIAGCIIAITGCDLSCPPNSPPPPVEVIGVSEPQQPQPVPPPPAEGFGMSAPQETNPLGKIRVSPQTNVVTLRSYSDGRMETVSPSMRIIWDINQSHGATKLDVVNATIGLTEWEQNTDEFASDTNAQVLFHLMQARQLLEGKTTTTEDGLPIIE